jgi:hypothetical protein
MNDYSHVTMTSRVTPSYFCPQFNKDYIAHRMEFIAYKDTAWKDEEDCYNVATLCPMHPEEGHDIFTLAMIWLRERIIAPRRTFKSSEGIRQGTLAKFFMLK